jgi:hypothetical protein
MRRFFSVGLGLLAAAMTLAGCDPGTGPSPTPAQLAARVYVLSPQQVPGYTRNTDNTINPQTLADQDRDPALASRLQSWGWRDGALAIYSPPKNNPAGLPFNTLSSQAIIFSDAAGARSFFSEEQRRINVTPPHGTIAPLAGASSSGVDDIVAFDSTQPSSNPGEGNQRAFIALIRKGQVVIELYGFAGANAVSPNQFLTDVTIEQELIQTPAQ